MRLYHEVESNKESSLGYVHIVLLVKIHINSHTKYLERHENGNRNNGMNVVNIEKWK